MDNKEEIVERERVEQKKFFTTYESQNEEEEEKNIWFLHFISWKFLVALNLLNPQQR